MKKIILTTAILLNSYAISYAGWLSDFVSDMDVLQPTHIQSAERNYLSFGSYSVRIKNVSINPVSVTPPSIDIGCNGIDIMTGGLSFMGKDSIKQLYKQLSNPNTMKYVGASIAMKMLSNELAGTVETAFDYMQKLNSMQLDGCGIADSAVSFVTDADYRANFPAKVSRAVGLSSSGIADSYDEGLKNSDKAVNKAAHIEESIPGYSAKEYLKNGGSLLDFIFTDWAKGSDNKSFPGNVKVDQIRALFGDVYYDTADGKPDQFRYVAPCENGLSYLSSKIYKKASPVDAKCQVIAGEDFSKQLDKYFDDLFIAYTNNESSPELDAHISSVMAASGISQFISHDAGAGDDYYLQNTINMFRDPAKLEVAYYYVRTNYEHLPATLEKFMEDAKSGGAEYGVALAEAVKNYIAVIQRINSLAYAQKMTAYNGTVSYYVMKLEIETSKTRGKNPLAEEWGAK